MARAPAGDVRIDLTADASQATAEFKKFGREAQQSAKAYEAGFDAARKRAQRSTRKIGQQTNTMTAGFQQAGTAISGATASLQLLGSTGNAAIGTVTASVASMAAQGFNPLGVAIGVATGALALFIAQADQTDEALEAIKSSLESSKKTVADLRTEFELLQQGILATPILVKLVQAEQKLNKLFKDAANSAGQRLGFTTEEFEISFRRQKEERENLSLAEQRYQTQLDLVKSLREQLELTKKVKTERKQLADEERRRRPMFRAPGRRSGRARSFDDLELTPLQSTIRDLPEKDPAVAQAARLAREQQAADLQSIKDQNRLLGIQLDIAAADAARVEEARRLNAELTKTNAFADDFAGTFTDTLSRGLADSIFQAQKLSDVMDNVLRTVVETAVLLGIRASVGAAFGAPGLALPGFRTGGSFTVGGAGGTDSQLVAFKATPGEHVSVTRPDQMGGAVTVNIMNASGERVATQERRSGNGREIDVMIGAVVRNIRNNGTVAQAMEQTFPIRRAGRPV